MYPVSNEWVAANDGILAPEGLIEISCYIPALNSTLVYTKKDILSFTHQQTGCLVSGELPKNYIEFTLDNSDGKWNPSNPNGLERYLSERLRITLRYGYVINGTERWIPGGIFYLSEWRTPQGGLGATFVARDVLEYMIDKPYRFSLSGTLRDAVRDVTYSAIPNDPNADVEVLALGSSTLGASALGFVQSAGMSVSSELDKYTIGSVDNQGNDSVATILQKCANAAGCVMYQRRNGRLTIEKLSYSDTGYTVPKKLSYSYPEIEFSRPLKEVSVTYSGNKVAEYSRNSSGETQTLSNDFISTPEQATTIAKWAYDEMRQRQKVSGEFRGDPRFDLFDVIHVENKYGTTSNVVLTDIKYTYTGAFRVTYSGYVHGDDVAATVYCGEVYTGEVV
jgi:hypothetical protein